jgi:hypothetical protein
MGLYGGEGEELLENNPAIQHVAPRVRLFPTGHWWRGGRGVRANAARSQRCNTRSGHVLNVIMALDY